MFDLIKKSYKKTKDAQYQKVSGGHCQSWVGPHSFCCAANEPRVIKSYELADATMLGLWEKSITKACAVNHSHKYWSGGLTRHRSRIAAALDKIILMIFDELMVEGATALGCFGVRLPAHPRAGPDAGGTP